MRRPAETLAYMNCPDCGLSVPLRAPFMTLDMCPRCLARRRIARPMVLSAAGAQPDPIKGHGQEHPLGPDVPAAA